MRVALVLASCGVEHVTKDPDQLHLSLLLGLHPVVEPEDRHREAVQLLKEQVIFLDLGEGKGQGWGEGGRGPGPCRSR